VWLEEGERAATWKRGRFTVLGSTESRAVSLSNAGHVAGEAVHPEQGPVEQATAFAGGQQVDLYPGNGNTTVSTVYAINDAGTMVGYGQEPGSLWTFLAYEWSGGQAHVLPTIGGDWSVGRAINQAGVIVGQSTDAGQVYRAAMWVDRQVINLNDLLDPEVRAAGWNFESANGINDHGWIVGDAYIRGANHGFSYAVLLKPRP
jgi:probable HAF family extracellular repeat protein